MAADIFVSFASKDVRVAMTLCAALESRGFTCWISARDIEPGENFQSAIVQALRRAKIMLLVFTANSNASEEMTKELALASQNKMIVIPLRVEDVTPNDAFAYEFATRQWIDVFADWEMAIDQLSRRVGQALLDRGSARAGAAADALKTVIASANAAKLVDPAPPADEEATPEAEAPAAPEAAPPAPEAKAPAKAKAAPKGDHPVEAAVKALEALEASHGAGDVAAEPAAALAPAPAQPAAPEPPVDAELPPAASAEPPSPEAPAARKTPVGLLIGVGVAILVVAGIAVAVIGHGGSKAPSVQAAAPESSTAASATVVATEPPASAAAPAAPTAVAVSAPVTATPAVATPPPAAVADAPGSPDAAAAPKPAKRKKAQPKVDIPF